MDFGSEKFYNNIEQIYGSLQDEQSKDIYKSRLLFSLTRERKNLYVWMYNPDLEPIYLKHIGELLSQGKVIAYGAGFRGRLLARMCKVYNGNITAYCDSDKSKQNCKLEGYTVISPEELVAKYHDNNIIITAENHSEIKTKLLDLGFQENQISLLSPLLIEYQQHLDRNIYFDTQIIGEAGHDEVFVDCGCLDGNDSIRFVKWCGNTQKAVIAFEPNPKTYLTCKTALAHIGNAVVYPYGVWNEKSEQCFNNNRGSDGRAQIATYQAIENGGLKLEDMATINTVALDEFLCGRKISFIKMDIEGAELNALKGAEKTIRENRPKLAISIYHKREDLWEIPAFILRVYKDYKLYLRQYNIGYAEVVLYAV